MVEYNGSIELISGIKPKNNGNFPLVNAHDVQVDDQGTRLDEKLLNIGGESYSIYYYGGESDPVNSYGDLTKVVLPEGKALQVGDLLVDANGKLYSVTMAQESGSLFKAEELASLKGADGVGIVSFDDLGGDETESSYRISFSDGTYFDFSVKNGKDGNDGTPGEKGEKGNTGTPGTDGKSAYAYAKEGGYTGTEEEFAEKLAGSSLTVMLVMTLEGGVYTITSADEITLADCFRAYQNGAAIYGFMQFIDIDAGAEMIGYAGIVNTVIPPDAIVFEFTCGDNLGHKFFVGATTSEDGDSWEMITETTLAKTEDIPTDDHINSLIDTKLGVIENGSY